MGNDQKNENIYALLIGTTADERDKLYREFVRILAGGPNIEEVNVCLLKERGQILVCSSKRGEQLDSGIRGRVQEILRTKFNGRCLVEYLHGASSQGLTGVKRVGDPGAAQKIQALESKLVKMEREAAEHLALAEEYAEGTRFKGTMEDVAAYFVTRGDQIKQLRTLEQSYGHARKDAGEKFGESALVEMLTSTTIPFRNTEEYKKMIAQLDSAKSALRRGKEEFVDVKKAQAYIVKAERILREADEREKPTGALRAAVKGKTLRYFVYTDVAETGQRVCLMMPVEENHQGILAKELIDHASSKVASIAQRENIVVEQSYRKGLVTFSLTPRSEDLERVYQTIINELFQSQRSRVFGAAGLRLDIETIGSTSGRTIEYVKENSTTRKYKQRGKRVEDEGESVMFQTLRAKLPGLPSDAFDRNRGMNKLLYMATLDILSGSKAPLRPVELRRMAPKYIPGYDPETPGNQTNYPKVIADLAKMGFVRKLGEGRLAPYELASNLRTKA